MFVLRYLANDAFVGGSGVYLWVDERLKLLDPLVENLLCLFWLKYPAGTGSQISDREFLILEICHWLQRHKVFRDCAESILLPTNATIPVSAAVYIFFSSSY